MKTSKLKMAISIILCFTIIFVSNTFSISAESENVLSIEPSGDYAYDINQLKILYSDRLDAVTLNEVIEVYLGDTELQLMYCSDARGAIDFVAEGLHNLSDVMQLQYNSSNVAPCAGSYPNYTTTVTPVRQARTYWCGPAAAVQALTGVGIYTQGLSDYSGAQQEMANLMNTTTSGSDVAAVKNTMTHKIRSFGGSSAVGYTKQLCVPSTMSKYTLINNLIGESIRQDRPCVATVLLSKLPYYSGTSTSGHYITIRAINGESGTAHIVDPHYSDAYFGNHVIYYDQLRTMLNGRYIIYTSSYA